MPPHEPRLHPVRTYTGSLIPDVYNANWQYFTNLTSDQIRWFQSQPEWADFVAKTKSNPTTTKIPDVINPVASNE